MIEKLSEELKFKLKLGRCGREVKCRKSIKEHPRILNCIPDAIGRHC